ncbi:MAG: B12-binding domain-containing radical SAM protein [Chloroflexi bacterium]|nr:B12-binding domain-containing radical SAM protein [Chloroflexota bacterium]
MSNHRETYQYQTKATSTSSPLRILLISPRGPLYRHRGGIWKKSLRYAPLTLATLASLIPSELNVEVKLLDEGIEEVDLESEADLIGISAITGSAPRSYEVADHFRRRGLPVVLGGVHPTLMPEEAARHADSVVVGYAEETWPQLLRDFAAGKMKARYVQNTNLQLACLPFPRRDLLPARGYALKHTIEATRGCIHQCEFCVVPTAWGGPLQRPIAEVIADIRQMRARRLIFLDLNLISDIAYAKELFEALIPLDIIWGGLATVIMTQDEELLDLAARSGCRGLLIGFETLSPESLVEAKKAFNARHDYYEVVRRLHDRGIAIQGTFVFGFDMHTSDTFAETVEFAIEANIDLPRYAILTPFPRTPLFRRLKNQGRILTEDWALYDGQHVVYQPHQISPETLLRQTEWAWKKTYSYRSIAKRLLGARIQPFLSFGVNLGYRFYAHHLHDYYNCDWMMGQQPVLPQDNG